MQHVILHNPRCSKSREALRLLQEQTIDVSIRDYINDPLTREELHALLLAVGGRAYDMVRHKDCDAAEHDIPEADDAAWLSLLETQPRLLERPIVWLGDRAIIARPPERLLDWL